MEKFDVNGVGVPNGNYFGMPYEADECPVVLVSVPWDATVSYSAGTAKGPKAIIDASIQVDLFDEGIKNFENLKIGTGKTFIAGAAENSSPAGNKIAKNKGDDLKFFAAEDYIELISKDARAKAVKVIDALAKGEEQNKMQKTIDEVNASSEEINEIVEGICRDYNKENKIVGVVGGEHSVTFGAVKAAAEMVAEQARKAGKGAVAEFGILQFDAHADLRKAYEGFEYSHASIMYNILHKIGGVKTLCQVGIRDFCKDEYDLMNENKTLEVFTDAGIRSALYGGRMTWDEICDGIIEVLPDNVYVSFDIDGLEPSCCPNTGTPVPGGLTYSEAVYLLRKLSGRKRIIGFDLCEVVPACAKGKLASGGEKNEWDANVGARLLHKLCLFAVRSLQK